MSPLSGPRPDPIECATAAQRVYDYVDGRLAAITRAEIERHLAICEQCASHFAFARMLRAALAASAPADSTDGGLRHRIRQAILRAAATADTDPERAIAKAHPPPGTL
jgi:anti-sigma factor (TIGR02949 family)